MRKKQSSANEGNIATNEEIEAAIEDLTPPQLLKLRCFAQQKVMKLGRKAQSWTWKDLLNEAYTSALDKRTWDKSQVDFLGFLMGAISSIASNQRAKFDRVEKSLGLGDGNQLVEVPLDGNADEGDGEGGLQIASGDLDPESSLLVREQEQIDKERIQKILLMAEEREFAPYIILEWIEEKSGPEIQRSLNITQGQYETEMRWIRRNARKTLDT